LRGALVNQSFQVLADERRRGTWGSTDGDEEIMHLLQNLHGQGNPSFWLTHERTSSSMDRVSSFGAAKSPSDEKVVKK